MKKNRKICTILKSKLSNIQNLFFGGLFCGRLIFCHFIRFQIKFKYFNDWPLAITNRLCRPLQTRTTSAYIPSQWPLCRLEPSHWGRLLHSFFQVLQVQIQILLPTSFSCLCCSLILAYAVQPHLKQSSLYIILTLRLNPTHDQSSSRSTNEPMTTNNHPRPAPPMAL